MLRMWLLWLRHRWPWISALGAALLALLLALPLALGRSDLEMQFLGNAGAPRPALARGPSGVILPRSSDPHDPSIRTSVPGAQASLLDQPPLDNAGPQTIAEAQRSWSTAELAQRQRELLTAINCARQQQGQPALTLDPALSRIAGDAWLQLIHDHAWSLMQLPGDYALRSVVALDFSMPQHASQAQGASCAVGGFDAGTLGIATSATAIGVALFPPQSPWDAASAIVLIQ